MLYLGIPVLLMATIFALRFNFWRPNLTGLPILMYHMISDDVSETHLPKLRVSEKRFRSQMSCLASYGYQTITLSEWLDYRCGKRKIPTKAIVITFDDGYKNFYTTAWPVLNQYGFSAVVFLVTNCIGGTNLWDRRKGEPEEPLLSEKEIKELAQQGVEFGSHSHYHEDLTMVSEPELHKDLTLSKRILGEILGKDIISFSYPFGKHNSLVRKIVDRVGFKMACTTHPGKNSKAADPLQLRRIIVKRKDTLLDFRLKLKKGKSRI
nr:polysaccharide deacetylase family protein [Desulfobacterales bacterium]